MLTKIDQAEAERIVGHSFQDYPFILHWTCQADTRAIVNLLRGRRKILELGTAYGYTTENIARFCGADRVVTVDLISTYPDLATLDVVGQEHEILSPEESGKVITSPIVEQVKLPPQAFFEESGEDFDGIFIDAGHKYKDVAADTAAALRHLEPGGIIVWHDVQDPAPDAPFIQVKAFLTDWDKEAYHISGTAVGFYVDKR